jgi:chemotaxis regulatin CheY-phosphate phosphatase CheZ
MSSDRAQALYYDSAAALRLVDTQLAGLGADAAPPADAGGSRPTPATPPAVTAARPVALSDLPQLLERANSEIQGLLARLRESRSSLQASAFDKLQTTQDKLREVTSATELAATDILDACDRATGKLDELDALESAIDASRQRATELRQELRDELFTMMASLQFQDITTQMINHATTVLVEVEQRLVDVATIFESGQVELPAAPPEAPAGELAYDPNATVHDADKRQAVADAVFTAVHRPTSAAA